jgi:hypothetical protein
VLQPDGLKVTMTDDLCQRLSDLVGKHGVRLNPRSDRGKPTRGRLSWSNGNGWKNNRPSGSAP